MQGRARHGALYPTGLGTAGLTLIAAGALLLGEGAAETVATVGGSLLLAWAHGANWRLRRCCGGRAVRPVAGDGGGDQFQ